MGSRQPRVVDLTADSDGSAVEVIDLSDVADGAAAAKPRKRRRELGLDGSADTGVPGLRLVFGAVTPDEEAAFLVAIAADTTRVPQVGNVHPAEQWGWRWGAGGGLGWGGPRADGLRLREHDRLAPIPRWVRDVLRRVEEADVERRFLPPPDVYQPGCVNHALLNRYPPGDGVTFHTDDKHTWTGFVLGLSLGSATTMLFRANPRAAPVPVRLPARSLYVLTGPARWQWQHAVAHALEDVVEGVSVPRRYRASVTLRTIPPHVLPMTRGEGAGREESS